MKSTRKLPVPISAKSGQPRSGKDFLIPLLSEQEECGFVGIKSGTRHLTGVLVFLGLPVTAKDIRSRAAESAMCNLATLTDEQLEAYFAALGDYKIGNVLSVSYAADGSFSLSKIAEMCQPPAKRNLP